jgi:hypothetical protein
MRHAKLGLILILAEMATVALAGCGVVASERGVFDRNFNVSGPVRIDLTNGSGRVEILKGSDSQVRIHGEVRAGGFTSSDARKRLNDILANPPIEQSGNVIRIGKEKFRLRNVSIDYRLEVPHDTEVESAVGSGSQSLQDIRGPARLTTGSGEVRAMRIREETSITSGSGSLEATDIGGDLRCTTGSGSVTISGVQGDVRITSGSGSITVSKPMGRVEAHTGSGGITIQGATSDLNVRAASGSLRVQGNPGENSFWDLHTASGGVELTVPSNASFRLSASAVSGGIQTDIPIVIEEQGRHSLRARVGNGGARVEVETVSGSIRIRGN